MLGFHHFPSSEHTGHRFGFNGMEKDDEVSGNSNNYTAQFWQYDSRLGRRWNVDPVTYPWQSSYAAFNNNPVIYTDPLGLFGSRREARQHRRENGLSGRIGKNEDGCFSINDRKSGTATFCDNELGLQTGALASAKKTNLPSNPVHRNMRMKGITSYGKGIEWGEGIGGRTEFSEGLDAFGKILIAGLSPMAISIAAPVLPELISTEFWAAKAAISASSQALTNDGKINLVGMGSDAILVPGIGDVVGSAFELKISLSQLDQGFTTRIVGGDKSLSEFGIQAGTSFLFTTRLQVLDAKVIRADKWLMPILYLPTSISSNALQRGLTDSSKDEP